MKYKNIKGEEIKIERWAWGVIYKDGTELKQFGDDGVFHYVGEIVQENVALFVMYKPADPTKRIDVLVPEGGRIIHKYKNVHAHYFKKFEDVARVFMFGFKIGSHYSYNFILPDDRMVVSAVENVDLPNFNLTQP